MKICKTVSKTKPTRRWCSKKKFQKLYSAHKEKKTVLKTFHRPTKQKQKVVKKISAKIFDNLYFKASFCKNERKNLKVQSNTFFSKVQKVSNEIRQSG